MYIGDTLLGCPRTKEEASKIYESLELLHYSNDPFILENASKLVEMNNEIYDKHKNTTWLQERIDILNTIKRTGKI